MTYFHGVLPALFFSVLCSAHLLQAQVPVRHKTEHVIFVMTDGLRWQEVFRGAEASLMDKKNGGVPNETDMKKMYWRETLEARRKTLMPFLWQVIAKEGQIFGNRDKGSDAYVTNGLFFSYPGYSEALCGFPDPRIHTNDKIPNPNATVLEWLKNRPAFQEKLPLLAPGMSSPPSSIRIAPSLR